MNYVVDDRGNIHCYITCGCGEQLYAVFKDKEVETNVLCPKCHSLYKVLWVDEVLRVKRVVVASSNIFSRRISMLCGAVSTCLDIIQRIEEEYNSTITDIIFERGMEFLGEVENIYDEISEVRSKLKKLQVSLHMLLDKVESSDVRKPNNLKTT